MEPVPGLLLRGRRKLLQCTASDHEVALDGLQPEVVRGMRREKFEPAQAVVDGRAADGPRQLR